MVEKLHSLLAKILHADRQLFVPGQWSPPEVGGHGNGTLLVAPTQRHATSPLEEPAIAPVKQLQSEANDAAEREEPTDAVVEAPPTVLSQPVIAELDAEPTFEAETNGELHKLQTPTPPGSAILNGAKLRQLRESLPEGQRTIQFVADCLSVKPSTVSRAETQNRGGLSTVYDYARLFDVPVDELLIQR